jgi:hypothetical protein
MQGGMTQVLVLVVEAGAWPAAGSTVLAGIRTGVRFSSRGARRRSQGQGRVFLLFMLVGG